MELKGNNAACCSEESLGRDDRHGKYTTITIIKKKKRTQILLLGRLTERSVANTTLRGVEGGGKQCSFPPLSLILFNVLKINPFICVRLCTVRR